MPTRSAIDPELAAFLRSVKESPRDDAPRLILADWLQERGDPRGEFIRVQCELARTSPRDRRRRKLAARERELLTAHAGVWSFEADDVSTHFSRGLLHVRLVGQRLLDGALPRRLGRLFDQGWVETLSMRLGGAAIPRLASWPRLAQVAGLDLSLSLIGEDELAALAESPLVQGRAELDLGYTRLPFTQLYEIARSGRLAKVAWIGRSCDNRLGYLRDVVGRAPGLACLNLSRFGPGGPDRLGEFLASPRVAGVSILNLEDASLGLDDARAIAAAPEARDYRALLLNGCVLGNAGVAALAASPHLAELLVLDVGRNGLRNAAAAAIADSASLRKLFYLQLEYNAIGDGGLQALAKSPHLAGLRTLDLGPNNVGDRGLKALAASKSITGLRNISLWGNRAGDAGVEALANSPNAAYLEEVYLGNNLIGDAGAKALANSPYLMNIRVLRLENNIGVHQNKVGARALKMLRDRFGPRLEA